MVGLTAHLVFRYDVFFAGLLLGFLKALPWISDDGQVLGTRVILQIMEDKNQYNKPDITNFGEQLAVKIRDVAPSAFAQLKPLRTIVQITDIEKCSVYGEYRNKLSIIARIAVVKE